MISYQLFTQTAVATMISRVGTFFPSVGAWLTSRMHMMIFIYAFAWVFLLSSAIPCVILGKERSGLVQFFVCLTLTFMAFMFLDAIKNYSGGPMDQLLSFAVSSNDPLLAGLYLSMPYLLMLALDIHSRKSRKKRKN